MLNYADKRRSRGFEAVGFPCRVATAREVSCPSIDFHSASRSPCHFGDPRGASRFAFVSGRVRCKTKCTVNRARIRTRCPTAASSNSSDQPTWMRTRWPMLRCSNTWHNRLHRRGSLDPAHLRHPKRRILRSPCRTTAWATTMAYEFYVRSVPGG